MNGSPPGSSVHGVLQARILEWVAVPSSRESSQPRDWTCVLMSSALAGGFFTPSTTWEAQWTLVFCSYWLLGDLDLDTVYTLMVSEGFTLSHPWCRIESVCLCVCVLSRLVMSDSSGPQCPWHSPGKNTGVGSHSFLQGIFPTQGSNPALPHYRQILYCLRFQGSPWIENPWVQILRLLLPSAGSLTSLSLNFLLCQTGKN